jgi:hypothetical protein
MGFLQYYLKSSTKRGWEMSSLLVAIHLSIFSPEEIKKNKLDGYKVEDNSTDKLFELKMHERFSDYKALSIITINRMTGYITYSNNFLDNKKSGFIDNGLGTCLKIDAPKKKF